MHSKLDVKATLTMSLSAPMLILGVYWLLSALYTVASSPGSLFEKLNNLTVLSMVFSAFFLISVATILASKCGFCENTTVRKLYVYSISAVSIVAGVLFIFVVGILGIHGF